MSFDHHLYIFAIITENRSFVNLNKLIEFLLTFQVDYL